jgi:hypothetical protein
MNSPYQRAKTSAPFPIPEVRDELLFTQRTLYELCQRETEQDHQGALAALSRATKLLRESFRENLHDIVVDVHNACDWALRQKHPPENVIRAAVLFAGTLLQHGNVAAALPLLKKIEPGFGNNRELKAVWAINLAIATERLYRAPNEDLWETAIQQMPTARWIHYPSLAVGCRNHIHRLREKHENDGDLQSLMAAMPLAERAYVALTHPTVKGSSFERSGSTVRLLIELARMQHATTQDGLEPLTMPSAVDLFKQAIINASVSREEEDLFARSIAALAEHYSSLGDREHARDFAMQGLIECAALKGEHSKLIEALQAILHANSDPEE